MYTILNQKFLDRSFVDDVEKKADFVPSFLKYPDFSHLRHFEPEAKKQKQPIETVVVKQNVVPVNGLITLKIRLESDRDFIEIDFDRSNTSFEQFKSILANELQLGDDGRGIVKIRKLPNVLVRNDKDIERLRNEQEIEICI